MSDLEKEPINLGDIFITLEMSQDELADKLRTGEKQTTAGDCHKNDLIAELVFSNGESSKEKNSDEGANIRWASER